MAQVDVPLVRSQFGQTSRAESLVGAAVAVFLGLSAFIAYSTWAALQGQHYRFGPYLSPFYSPELIGDPLFRLVRSKAGLDARLGHGGRPRPLGPGRIPRDVLLLPRRVITKRSGGPSFVHGGGAPQEVSRGALLSVDPAKRPSIFSVSRVGVLDFSCSRTSGMRFGLTDDSASG